MNNNCDNADSTFINEGFRVCGLRPLRVQIFTFATAEKKKKSCIVYLQLRRCNCT